MKNYRSLICPVCKKTLVLTEKTAKCENGHSFDRASEGYFNLIRNAKPLSGDSPEAVTARKLFLSGGYYANLSEYLCKAVSSVSNESSVICDICCGEGYYTSNIANTADFGEFYGFDLSKRAIRYAAKAADPVQFFIANISEIPLADESVDIITHLFAPVNEKEFQRILKPNGVFIHVFPGKSHLWQMKKALYDVPYENDEKPDVSADFKLVCSERLKSEITLAKNDIENLFKMTPYFYRTPKQAQERLLLLDELKTETEFIVNIYRNSF